MVIYEKLYLANNLASLDLLAKKTCNVKKLKFQNICNLLNKLYKETQFNVLDQEKTYILLARYLNLYNQLVQADKKFVELRFGSEFEKVLVQYEETKKSLEERYALNVPNEPPAQVDETKVEEKPRQVFYDEFITCQQLFSALQKKCNILLVDARPDHDFSESRFDHPNCINVPDQCITAGLSANALGKKLSGDTQKIWDMRDTFDVIVLYDWNTSSENIGLTKLNKLRSALVDWDLNRNYRERPVILNGGYLELLQTYPTMCINPHVYLSQKNNELDELLELDNIKYPTESDNKSQVMGPPEDKTLDEVGPDDESELVSKEALIKENKEITLNRQNIISQLLHEESEWKKVNDLCNEENNIINLSNLKQKEAQIRSEISRLEIVLDELNKKKDDVQKKYERNFEYDPEDEIKSEDLKEIIKIEEDDTEKLRILDTIAEERCKALKKARALKPKIEGQINDNINEKRETERPVINRATKPTGFYSHIARTRVEPLQHVTAGLVGLKNIRNTCYMSTVIQCIRNIPTFMRLFCSGTYTKYNIRTPAAIIHETAALIRQLWSKSVKSIDPQEFYNKVGALEATYRLGNHEDCMEFFLFLLNHLSEDCCYDINKLPNIMTPKQRAWYNQFEGKNSIFIDLFYHQIRIRQNCQQCDQKTIKFEIESTFMLSVPEHDFNLNQLMAEYMADYIIPEYCCAKCKKPVNNQKEICYEPKIMVIVLKRYRQVVVNGVVTLKKVESKAHFQKNNFRLGNCYYKLRAIAMHSGDMNYGHYTAAALTPKGWFEFNDEIVKPTSINDESLKIKACAFFYSMCDD